MFYKDDKTQFHAFAVDRSIRIDLGSIDGYDAATEYVENMIKK
jgi:hypothetical protein